MSYSNILIAIDGSSCSMNALEKGIELAKALSANVMLLSVVDMTTMIDTAGVGAVMDTNAEKIFQEEAQKLLKRAMKKYPYAKMTPITEEGIPKEAINPIAEKHHADLIVMGTHGRTGLEHFFMGSVAEQVIRHAKIPVMVVNSSED